MKKKSYEMDVDFCNCFEGGKPILHLNKYANTSGPGCSKHR